MIRKTDLKSIRFRTWVYLMLFSATILVVLWLMQIVFMNSIYKAIKIRSIYSAAQNVVNIYEKIEGNALSKKLEAIANDNDIFINITNSSGVSLYSIDPVGRDYRTPVEYFNDPSRADRSPLLRDAFSIIAQRILEQPKGQLIHIFSDKQGRQMLLFGKIIRSSSNEAALLMMSSPLQPLTDTVRILKRQLLFVTLLIIGLSALISSLIALHVSRPLTRITKKASLLASGNYDLIFEQGTFSEVNQLADTLNYAVSALKQVEGLRNELVANISHDLRTPLTMIKVYAEIIRDINGDNKQKRNQNVAVIIEECDRLTNLVQDLLDLSKMQSGVAVFKPQQFGLTEMVKQILKRYDALIQKEGYVFEFSQTKPLFVIAEQNRIEQVVYNLLNNAVNHTGADKRIKIALSERNEFVRVLVSDSGEGILPENIEKIWDRYYKVDQKQKREVIGTGLGLSIVKSVLELHGMNYGVDSIPGKGSTFWFDLRKHLY